MISELQLCSMCLLLAELITQIGGLGVVICRARGMLNELFWAVVRKAIEVG